MFSTPMFLLVASYILMIFIPILFYILRLRNDQIDLEHKVKTLYKEKSELEGKLMLKDEELRAYHMLFKHREKNNYERVDKNVNKTINKSYGIKNEQINEGIQV